MGEGINYLGVGMGNMDYGFDSLLTIKLNNSSYNISICHRSLSIQTLSSTSTGSIPKKGLIGNPGLGVELSGEGRGVIIIPPVSVIISTFG